MFSHLPTPTLDPILSLSVAYKNDTRTNKVDLGIGVYRNDVGETPVMQAVQKAQDLVVANQTTKSYVGLAGCEEFNQGMMTLLLGNTSVLQRSCAIQTPGASGALRMLADLIKVARPNATVWISDPSYVNHKPVMEAAGLIVKSYRYFDQDTKQVDSAAMLADLAQIPSQDVVLLHGCCHNPTGADIDFSTWQQITELAKQQGFIPFIDVAYQGFGDGLEQDVQGLRYMAQQLDEVLLTVSCSKNFGLYRERTGVAIVVGKTQQDANNAKGKLLQLARATYTMPPDHGARLVTTILQSAELTKLWQQELMQMQARLQSLREQLCASIKTLLNNDQFDFILSHKGMFTMLGFSESQMMDLREQFGIYAVGDGRVNIAGLSTRDIDYVANAIATISQQ